MCFCYNIGFQKKKPTKQNKKKKQKKNHVRFEKHTSFFKNIFYLLLQFKGNSFLLIFNFQSFRYGANVSYSDPPSFTLNFMRKLLVMVGF